LERDGGQWSTAGRPEDTMQDRAGGAPGGQPRSSAMPNFSVRATTTPRPRDCTRFRACHRRSEVGAEVTDTGQVLTGTAADRVRRLWSPPHGVAHGSDFFRFSLVVERIDEQERIARRAIRRGAVQGELVGRRVDHRRLYRAAGTGSRSNMVIRGMCAPEAGRTGLSENIRERPRRPVLEHSRVFRFGAGRRSRVLDRVGRHNAPQTWTRGRSGWCGSQCRPLRTTAQM